MPHAVTISKVVGKYIPNIYCFANVNNTTITFNETLNSYTDDDGNTFKDGIGNTNLFTKDSDNKFDTLIFVSPNGGECRREIINIIDEKTFEIDAEIDSEYINDTKVFVYGQEINDFHSLNKDAIWTTAAAALQEVDRIQQADAVKIKTLENKNIDLENKVSKLETQLNEVLNRLSLLENN